MNTTPLPASPDGKPRFAYWKPLLFLAVFIGGLFYVKWEPYFHKAILAATNHDIGGSILATTPEPSLAAAWDYSVIYFKAVWKAAILGIVLGSLIQVLLPRDWMKRFFGKRTFGSTVAGGISSMPGMMCSCCAAPVAVGMRKQSGSVGAALAFWIGNPVLNPATIIFMGFVLGWKFAVLRILAGIVLVFGVSHWAGRLVHDDDKVTAELPETPGPKPYSGSVTVRWMKTLWSMFWTVIPVYFIAVFLLGAVRAWLFPAIDPAIGSSILVLIGLALAGTLFVIPTAAEIPIAKTMMSLGLGSGPAAALMMTLPAVSLPSLFMVRKAFPARALWFVAGMVALIGIVTGFIAMAFL
ncbi:permease [Paenibacillus lutrae]|uniref:Permease n=1 Tax=Paenibacillus lutrae TaxID=2078573 RepID=A0A7X3K0Y7_9BACL|nr:permease [Paenibacillus lutrae]